MKGLVLRTNGEIEVKELTKPLYKSLRAEIGGYIEIVRPATIRLPDHFVMVVDEEGLLKGLPSNVIASIIYGGPIVGDVVFIREGMTIEGFDFIETTDANIERLKNFFDGLLGASWKRNEVK